uniref:Reverse transcriptase/retrotransposon-derived protein RNase H-like domain-containing protein n=1 Tax=Gouania willdenowi TaxID=441366 RepID=A0A8C5EHT7_GOUWI
MPCEFSKDKIVFVGHCVTAKGVSPEPNKVKATMEMPEPTNAEGVRRIMGMANYLAKFLPHLASYTKSLKDLLSGKNKWCWGVQQKEAFQKLKIELSSLRGLAPYSLTAETCVAADASSYGLGAVLTQEQPTGTWRPIVFISRCLTEAEKHYAQTEKEALAVAWACERLAPYIHGLRFKLETDHKPLTGYSPEHETGNPRGTPQCIVKCRARARQPVWWPGLSVEISHVHNTGQSTKNL